MFKNGQRLRPVCCFCQHAALFLQYGAKDHPVDFIIFHDQNLLPRQLPGRILLLRGEFCGLLLLYRRERNGHAEHCALSLPAFYLDGTVHLLHQRLAQRRAQAGAAL